MNPFVQKNEFHFLDIVEFTNSIDSAHNEPPYLDLQCMPTCFEFSV